MAEHQRLCASCRAPNEVDARFCEGCGESLARVCGTCGVQANAKARFCRGCGTPLDDSVAQNISVAGPSRKTVTVMFADLAGSTSFEEKVDAETVREVMGGYHDLLRLAADRHRAGVTKYIGDGFMAVWGVPEIGPDDASHAVDAAVELQELFVDLAARVALTHGVELALRVAVNTGEVVVGAGDADLVGDALNVGARLEAECPRGHVVVGEETWRSTRGRHGYESLGEVQVKGRSAPVALYRWLGRHDGSADTAPFVGRADEAERLRAVLDDAVAARAARLVTVIGDPGVGKSRLAAEFTGSRPDARAIEARCDVEATVALAPIVEVLRTRDLETDVPAGVPERVRLLRDLDGLAAGVAGSVEETFWALRRYVEVLAGNGPVLLVFDDVQWANALLLDLIEHLVEWVADVPVVVLALARPELREIRPNLVTVSRWVSEAVHLGGLDAAATAELAAKVVGATRLPEDLLRRLPASTGGNPLFVRELIGMLAYDGVLVEQPTGWQLTIDVDAITIPPTIHALLASRLERLDVADRRTLEIASVVGSDFSLGAVRALAGSGATDTRTSLDRLRRLELAQPSGAFVGDEPVWRFHHVLIRDVAYRRLLKSDRADLHERLADWFEAGGASVTFDAEEMIARHLESAHTYRRELGSHDVHTAGLALRSARHYAASARRALDRDELVSAGTQAARGAELAASDAAVHADLLLTGCEAFLSAGDVAAGASLVDDLERIAGDVLAPWATCYRSQFIVYTEPERLLEVDARLQSAIDEFGSRRDQAGLAKAHRVRAGARARLGRIGDCETDLFKALIAARQSGDHRQITAALGAAPSAALWGPSPVPKAGGRCLDVVRMQRMTTAAPSLEATSLRHLAVLELLRGRPDKARTMLADARQVVADLGLRHGLMETELFAGIIESMEGNPVVAEPHFRTALEGLDALGAGADAGLAAALLARSVLAQGRLDEADRYAAESESLAGRNLQTAIAWRSVRAEILSAQGHHDEAATMAREAVAVAAGTDLVLDHALACLALGRVLDAGGDAMGARRAHDDADRLSAAKEVTTTIGREAKPAGPAVPRIAAAAASTTSGRLAVTNQSCEFLPDFTSAMRAHHGDGVVKHYSDRFAYVDHRRLGADPITGIDQMRRAIELVFEQYTQFDLRVLAVRGERLQLLWNRLSDNDGNETTTLWVNETGDDGRIEYQSRFDEDDFEGAYRDLDERYFAGEGKAYAEVGAVATEWVIALNRGDVRRAFELGPPNEYIENRSRTAFPDPSVIDPATSFRDLETMVVSMRTWPSAGCWLQNGWFVVRIEREAVGRNDETYAWSWLNVGAIREGRFVASGMFDVEDEDAAFAYAEERMRATSSRLAVTNESVDRTSEYFSASRAHEVEGALAFYADDFVYDDRRGISGGPVRGRESIRAAIERLFEQYTRFDFRVMAVRGRRLCLLQIRIADDAGNETTTFDVVDIDEAGLSTYLGRFDEHDFGSAYRELDARFYAGEGATCAEAGLAGTEVITALNANDFDRAVGEFSTPDLRVENRSRSAFPARSGGEMRASFAQLNEMVATSRTWLSATRWLSQTWNVARLEREAVGQHGEQYAWTWILVSQFRGGRMASICEFELEDEDAAFAYAQERLRESTSRLAVTNRLSELVPALVEAMSSHDVEGTIASLSERFVYDDRRRLGGDPIVGLDAMRRAVERIFAQYHHFEFRVLAVRGERLDLLQSRWWDDDGNESTTLYVNEAGDDGLTIYQGRFDEDDFEGAYRELGRRYHAREGAAFAEAGGVGTEWPLALNEGDFDRLFGELATPDLRLENRSRSGFPDLSAAELRVTLEDLAAMMVSTRSWISVTRWVSPHLVVGRVEREAVGRDGASYTWCWILLLEIRDGRVAAMRQYDVDDEEAAFAYAEEWAQETAGRLPVTNRASEAGEARRAAMSAADVDAAVACCAVEFVQDDRRRLSGDPIRGLDDLRLACEGALAQYSEFEVRTVAVRGDRLQLFRGRWSNDAGYESTHLGINEVDADGRISYQARFDEDDFESAYRELERRYGAGEGVEFAEAAAVGAELMIALNEGDLDRFGELTAPGFILKNRSRGVFPDRSAAQFHASFGGLAGMVSSTRQWATAVRWLSPATCVGRLEREAVGHDGERYAWSWIAVSEFDGGLAASLCIFEADDEEVAFTYAEELVRAASAVPTE